MNNNNNNNDENSTLIKVPTMETMKILMNKSENNNQNGIVLSEINNNLHNNFNNISQNYDVASMTDSVSNTDEIQNNDDNVKTNLQKINEKGTSILLHVFIMGAFEIYFYFNYVIKLEKTLMTDKINSYLNDFGIYFEEHSNNNMKTAIKYFFDNLFEGNTGAYLKNEYLEAKAEQASLLNTLFMFCYKLMALIGSVFLLFVIGGCFFKHRINWKLIIIENIAMLVFLGLLEYVFFKNVILMYSPFTDEEIKYMVYKEIVKIINGTFIE
jgi:hypothetical protein